MALPFQKRVEVARALRTITQNDSDQTVRNRCTEVLALLRAEDREALCTTALQVLQNTQAATAARLRALDIIFWLIE